jgi:hypothetical protein
MPNGQGDANELDEIRELLKTHTHRAIAERFGASQTTIGNIATGRFYSRPSKLNYWTPEEDDKLRDCVSRGLSLPETAKELGRPKAATTSRVYRIGLTSGRKPTRDYSTPSQRQGEPR